MNMMQLYSIYLFLIIWDICFYKLGFELIIYGAMYYIHYLAIVYC